MKRRWWQLASLGGMLVCAVQPAAAQTVNAPLCGTGVHESEAIGVVGFPQDQIFCPLIADPKQPRSFASLLRGTFPSIEKPSGKGTMIGSVGLGDYFGLVRWGGPRAGEGVQLDVVGAIFAQFDLDSASNELIRDKAEFEAHWTKGLERWFQDGVDTPGLVLIKVHANRIHYWDGENEGEVVV